ncbi:hypothetical protein AC480_02615 [miscellaneous Crenarchaeota group archaeon SMTZ1-55]|nr:MAG: hypothetical protein AC480_02615 [miscellaneous Crenarchaeota group archaeon SMTZ1-55]
MFTLLFVYSGAFGERVIRNMINDPSFCKVCAVHCDFCKYGVYSYVQNIHAAIALPDPAQLPRFIEDAAPYFPKHFPAVDLCIATGLHHDLLLELPQRLKHAGIRGLITPIEDFANVPSGLRQQVAEACEDHAIEYAAPKPFCALKPPPTMPLLSRFTDAFKIGKPRLRITTASRGGATVIYGVTVERSAPCGSTWYVAKKLMGKVVQREALHDVVAKAHHSYPCTATMGVDPELSEPLLHTAGYLIRAAVEDQLLH